ncbi:GNAT family N-acetyltransferase [Tamlana sp. 2201CG12-4]|uniref:GNAT family N-acetyltransferase n=1 Tax=Tamlana sp. 2201CG12-4 TaxID=3112582 RepID=UPI002DBD71B9|nr:GNAT family N-acetyltransferase [Tamlana sp. 2201CG12-4]MEC3907726.1 GNAT family N-acetyltransferase [Tamlana sp. 2201CG12-4]
MELTEYVLDNPVWYSLTEIHTKHCINYGNIKFYQADYAPFGAFVNNQDTSKAIEAYSKLVNSFFIVGQQPKVPTNFSPPIKYVGLQMIIYNKINHPITEKIIELKDEHYQDLIELVELVYPHFFKAKTNTLGRYYGIYKDNKLVAVTGERMQTKHFTEISAVVTHPDYLGNGFAKQLVAYTANQIFHTSKTPFLHVDQNNFGPINLYKKLGFVLRRELHYWKISN